MTLSAGTTPMSTQAIGAIGSTVGSYFSSSGQKAALEAEASIADTNSKIATLKANSAIQQGAERRAIRPLARRSNEVHRTRVDGGERHRPRKRHRAKHRQFDRRYERERREHRRGERASQRMGLQERSVELLERCAHEAHDRERYQSLAKRGIDLLTSASSMAMNGYMLNKAGAFDKDSWGFMSKMFGS